ncbi:MAG: chorismate synthase [Alphaproteobacteria bacterium]|nr:chorismate synthase [Alphaproteobacteria bacterium]
MPGNTFGQFFRLTTWGESHGVAIGGVLDGVPSGLPLTPECIQTDLNRRKPGNHALTSPRLEKDEIEILSGVFEGKTLGTPIAFMVRNQDHHSKDYDALKSVYRPGHGDYTYQQKYNHRDYRGGGRSSARETIARVVGGAIGKIVLKSTFGEDIKIRAAITQIGPLKINLDNWDWDEVNQNAFSCPDKNMAQQWEEYLTHIKEQGKSAGALIEIYATGFPAGLGEPVFDKLNADLAKGLMSINAVKAVEIGSGFDCVAAESSYDEMILENGNPHFLTNHAGGMLAGISMGQPIVCKIAVKPTSSTLKPRQTITTDLKETTLSVTGRHDPCVAIRAIPIAEAMVSLVLADHALRWRGQCGPFDRVKK